MQDEIDNMNLNELGEAALDLLAAVVMEWSTDPMSVQCFDLRMVDRGKAIVYAHRRMVNVALKEVDPIMKGDE